MIFRFFCLPVIMFCASMTLGQHRFCNYDLKKADVELDDLHVFFYTLEAQGLVRHFKGNFVNATSEGNNPEEVMVMGFDNGDKVARVYSYCQTSNSMHDTWSSINGALGYFNIDPGQDRYVVGDFAGAGYDQILALHPSNGHINLIKFIPTDNCNTYTNSLDWQYLWGTDKGKITDEPYNPFINFFKVGDFNGDGKDELLMFNTLNATWHLFGLKPMFSIYEWELLGQGIDFDGFSTFFINDQNSTVGKFLENDSRDGLFFASDLHFFPSHMFYLTGQEVVEFESLFETFDPELNSRWDNVYSADFTGEGVDEVINDNRESRYDMKTSQLFTQIPDPAMFILGNLDYIGYEDPVKNPKYYENFEFDIGQFVPLTGSGDCALIFGYNNSSQSGWLNQTTGLYCSSDVVMFNPNNQGNSRLGKEENESSDVTFGPNPATNNFYINTKEELAISEIRIYNSLGLDVLALDQKDLEKGTDRIAVNIAQWPNGTYFILAIGKNGEEYQHTLIVLNN